MGFYLIRIWQAAQCSISMWNAVQTRLPKVILCSVVVKIFTLHTGHHALNPAQVLKFYVKILEPAKYRAGEVECRENF